MDNQDFVTKEYLDKKLQDHSQILVEALGGILVKRLDELKDELKKDINNVQVLIDGYVKAQEEFKQKFIIMKEEMKKIKDVLREKLGVEIRAI
jgi:adenosyl cobinamide kinase/adenosyl cobinamide phosphate guanylyltransferase